MKVRHLLLVSSLFIGQFISQLSLASSPSELDVATKIAQVTQEIMGKANGPSCLEKLKTSEIYQQALNEGSIINIGYAAYGEYPDYDYTRIRSIELYFDNSITSVDCEP